VEATYPICATA
jgi:Aminoglycoside-2''-adenylyltransferase